MIWLFVAGGVLPIFVVGCSDESEESVAPATSEVAPAALAPAVPSPVPATAATAPSGGPKYGGTLRVTLFSDNTTLDPPMQLSTNDIITTQSTYDNLVMVQPDLTMKPELATSWRASDDLKSYTFELREGVKFHHGKDFKAEDVVFSYNRLLDPILDSPARTTMGIIEHMEVLGDHTIRFDLGSASAFFPETLSMYQARITASDIDPARLTSESFGTGPFMLTEYLPGERTVMARNPNYWEEGRPYLDEVTFILIPEPETRAEALKSGDVDLIYLMQHTSARSINDHTDTTVLETASPSYLNLAMDTRVPPFDNKLVRQAIQAATDRESIRQTALLGRGSVAYDHPISPNDPHFAPQYAPPDYDPELAKSLLAQAGFPDGVDITLYTSTAGTGMVEMAVTFQAQAAAGNVRVELKQMPEDAYWANVWMQEAFTTVFWNGRPPDQALSIVYLSDANWNESFYKNPTLDNLIVKARGQLNLADRQETYAEIQRILIDEVPRIVVVFQPILLGARNDVRGIAPHPETHLILSDGWLDR